MKRFFIIASSFVLLSCSQNYYVPVTSSNSATVSFSNLSPEIPEINIINNCVTRKINHDYIEQKKPTDIAKHTIPIPIGKEVSFQYKYFWISGEMTIPITFSNNHDFQNQTKLETRKEIQTCNKIITFIPEKNKHYEIYFGKVTNHCEIKVSEAYYNKLKHKNNLYAIKLLNNQSC